MAVAYPWYRRRSLKRGETKFCSKSRVRGPHPTEIPAAVPKVQGTSVWGTWHGADRTMRLAAVLRHMPPRVLEGVVAHELCHATWRTHGPRFRALLRRVDPDADWARGFLDGAQWFARNSGRIPPSDLGPLTPEGGTGG